ncbi:unnamed protein product [Peniophora sp. CBMAI 1063]|nr:unnamed protein product [Peniophora sp. CBMAI 1063]
MSLDYTTRLSDEILLLVFTNLRDMLPVQLRPSSAPQGPRLNWLTDHDRRLGWPVVTFVCSRWRRIAISSPALWSEVVPHLGGGWLSEFGRRSKSMPLSLNLRELPITTPSNIITILPAVREFLRQNQARIHTLELSQVWDFLEDEYCFEHLERLVADVHRRGPHTRDANIIFRLSAPRLRYLKLTFGNFYSRSTRIDWQAMNFHELETLVLKLNHDVASLQMPSMFKALQNMPRLSELSIVAPNLSHSFPLVCVQSCPCLRYRPYCLPALARLSLNDDFRSTAHFLQHVRVPSVTYVRVNERGLSGAEAVRFVTASVAQATQPVLKALPRFYAATVWSPDPLSKSIYGQRDRQAYATHAVVTLTRSSTPSSFSIEQPYDFPLHTVVVGLPLIEGTIRELASAYHFRSLRALSLEGYKGGVWIGTLIGCVALRGLEFLRLSRGYADGHALNSFLCDNDESGNFPFPNLRTLDLLANFTLKQLLASVTLSLHGSKLDGTGFVAAPQTVLENIVHTRRDVGYPLDDVYVRIEESIAELRAEEYFEHMSCELLDDEGLLAAVARLEMLGEVRIVGRSFAVEMPAGNTR